MGLSGRAIFFLILSAAILVQLTLIAIFVTLQVVVNPRNHPQYFSIVPGGDEVISHLGVACHNIEVNTFTPNIRTYAIVTSTAIVLTSETEDILVNSTLNVGYDSSQLTYYGIPVSSGVEMTFNIRSSNMNLNSLSVRASVYEVEGFSEFLAYTSNNVNPLSTHNLNSVCLLSTSGCRVSLESEYNGWVYVVFQSVPTPSTLVVSLEASVLTYEHQLATIISQCTIDETSPRCHLQVPTDTTVRYDSDGDSYTDIEYLPFNIVYQAESLVSNPPPPSQALNISVDLSWTCSRTDLYTYTILFSILAVTSFISLTVLVIGGWFACGKPNLQPSCSCRLPSMTGCGCTHRRKQCIAIDTGATDVVLETVATSTSGEPSDKSYIRAESLPPSYEKVLENEDEAPYYKT